MKIDLTKWSILVERNLATRERVLTLRDKYVAERNLVKAKQLETLTKLLVEEGTKLFEVI